MSAEEPDVSPWVVPPAPPRPAAPVGITEPAPGHLWWTAERFEDETLGYDGLLRLLVLILRVRDDYGRTWWQVAPVDEDVEWATSDDAILHKDDTTDGAPLRVCLADELLLARGQLDVAAAQLTDSGSEAVQAAEARLEHEEASRSRRRSGRNEDFRITRSVLAAVSEGAAGRESDVGNLLAGRPELGRVWVVERPPAGSSALNQLLGLRSVAAPQTPEWHRAVARWWADLKASAGGAWLTPAPTRGADPSDVSLGSSEGVTGRLREIDGRLTLRLVGLPEALDGRRLIAVLLESVGDADRIGHSAAPVARGSANVLFEEWGDAPLPTTWTFAVWADSD